MVKHYDKRLREKLPTNNLNNGSGVVLNIQFDSWEDHISRNLKYPHSYDKKYSYGKDKELLELCREHALAHESPIQAANIVAITHPLYLHLTHMYELSNPQTEAEAAEYLDRLIAFLGTNPDRSKVGIVALETLHHYAAATSLLLEEGLIDKVIFTEFNSGEPLKHSDLDFLKYCEVFFAGGYNQRCLSSSVRETKRKVPESALWAIKELVLNSPQDYRSTLKTSQVKNILNSHVVSLEQALTMIGLQQ